MKQPTIHDLEQVTISANAYDSWRGHLLGIIQQIEADLAAIGKTSEDIELSDEVFLHYGGPQGAIAVIMPYEIEGPDGRQHPRVFRMMLDRTRGDWTWFSGDVRDD